ncbi:hypothetical protein D9619_006897 [Psilocybe cf. subviscida]|uniref:Uncharacterized protein n=1 Tax=Psilocybe cf. subviscida TaxID=2480587 RepID=A0A8H5B537_9AGAR|nr:hypothetical protein D9619_006897 [Psilocybe cf. subviscida]
MQKDMDEAGKESHNPVNFATVGAEWRRKRAIHEDFDLNFTLEEDLDSGVDFDRVLEDFVLCAGEVSAFMNKTDVRSNINNIAEGVATSADLATLTLAFVFSRNPTCRSSYSSLSPTPSSSYPFATPQPRDQSDTASTTTPTPRRQFHIAAISTPTLASIHTGVFDAYGPTCFNGLGLRTWTLSYARMGACSLCLTLERKRLRKEEKAQGGATAAGGKLR